MKVFNAKLQRSAFLSVHFSTNVVKRLCFKIRKESKSDIFYFVWIYCWNVSNWDSITCDSGNV